MSVTGVCGHAELILDPSTGQSSRNSEDAEDKRVDVSELAQEVGLGADHGFRYVKP